MFRELILDSVADGAKSASELYAIARTRQPRDYAETSKRAAYGEFRISSFEFRTVGTRNQGGNQCSEAVLMTESA